MYKIILVIAGLVILTIYVTVSYEGRERVDKMIVVNLGVSMTFVVLLYIYDSIFDKNKAENKLEQQSQAVVSANNIDEIVMNDDAIRESDIVNDDAIKLPNENDTNNKESIKEILEKNDGEYLYDFQFPWNEYLVKDSEIRYIVQNGVETERVIVVSYYQQEIDWEKVREAGIDAAIIRVGYRGYSEEGVIHEDVQYKRNIENAIANGIKVGVFFFSQATNKSEMDEEISFILSEIENYDILYPVCIEFDWSGEVVSIDSMRIGKLSVEQSVDLIEYFCLRIKNSGYVPMMYASDVAYQGLPAGALEGCLKWVYTSKEQLFTTENCIIWQYRAYTRVAGIQTDISLGFSAVPFL